jgi:hypothetical protein
MARSFIYFIIENFPNLQINQSIETGGLFPLETYAEECAYSKIRYLGSSENQFFNKYKVDHETQKKLRHRVKGEIYNILIEQIEFELYKHVDGYFMSTSGRKELIELIRRFDTEHMEWMLQLKMRQVDLAKLHSDTMKMATNGTEVTGGHFRNLKVDKVNAASIFGHDVGESLLWGDFEQKGELSALIINVLFYNENTSVMITRQGTILQYGSYSESVALELVDNINQLITPYCENVPVSISKGRRK